MIEIRIVILSQAALNSRRTFEKRLANMVVAIACLFAIVALWDVMRRVVLSSHGKQWQLQSENLALPDECSKSIIKNQ